MPLDRYVQQPADKRRRTIDYNPWLEDTETLTDVTVVISPLTSPPFVVDGVTFDPDGKQVIYFASGGVDGVTYKADFRVTTSLGQIREDEIEFDLEET